MKTVTQLMREPCFNDYVVEDDRTNTVSVVREYADGDEIELFTPALDIAMAACG